MKAIEKYINDLADAFSNGMSNYCYSLECENCPLNKFCEKKKEDLIEYFNSEVIDSLINDLEYDLLKHLDKELEWIARNSTGELMLFDYTPEKGIDHWEPSMVEGESYKFPYKDLFQFIKWEDEDPILIEDLILNYERVKENEKKTESTLKD